CLRSPMQLDPPPEPPAEEVVTSVLELATTLAFVVLEVLSPPPAPLVVGAGVSFEPQPTNATTPAGAPITRNKNNFRMGFAPLELPTLHVPARRGRLEWQACDFTVSGARRHVKPERNAPPPDSGDLGDELFAHATGDVDLEHVAHIHLVGRLRRRE